MAKAPEGMVVLPVIPSNYDEIIDRSKKTCQPYTSLILDAMYTRAKRTNSYALVMFMDIEKFWNGEG